MTNFKRNKKHKSLHLHLEKPFCCYKRKNLTTEPSSLVHSSGNIPPLFDLEVMQDVNKKLATKLYATKSVLETKTEET